MRFSPSSSILSFIVVGVVAAAVFGGCSDGAGGNDKAPAAGSGGSAASAGASAISGTPAGAGGHGGSGTAGATAGSGTSGAGVSGGGAGGAGGGMGGQAAMGATSGAGASGSAAGGTSAHDAGMEDAGAGSGGTGGAGGSDVDAGPVAEGPRACHSQEDWAPQAGDVWISPSGNDSNDGSDGHPKKTLAAALSAWSAGKTIWVAAGTYALNAPVSLSTKATSASPLRISGVTGGAKPLFDFSGESRATNNDGQRGFQLSGSYVHLRYLEIAKASDNCVYVTGSNNTLEWLTVHECQDTGVQLSNGAANNQVLNVDSYLNADPTGENADGFAPKLSIGTGNYFCGTRSYENADDGYDCWSSGDSSPVKFEYCWAFGQPGPTATANGDGNGFKLGSPTSLASGGNAPHELHDCFAFHNRSTGFTSNGNNSGNITCTNCGVWGNGTAWSAGTNGVAPKHTGDITTLDVTVDKAMNAARDGHGDLPDISTL